MDYSQYYKAREIITNIMKEDLLGPIKEEEVIMEEPPVSYYITGKLYPRNIRTIYEENEEIQMDENALNDEEDVLSLGSGIYPSAVGMTFALCEGSVSFSYEIEAACYELEQTEDKYPKKGWRRKVLSEKSEISIDELVRKRFIRKSVYEDLCFEIRYHQNTRINGIFITATLFNNATAENYGYQELSKHTYFQPVIRIGEIKNGQILPLHPFQNNSGNRELLNMDLLYHDTLDYASGHGCAVEWETDEDGYVTQIGTVIVPQYSVYQMSPQGRIDSRLFSMNFLASDTFENIENEIGLFLDSYKEWIQEQRKRISGLNESLQLAAEDNLKACEETCSRIEHCRKILSNPTAFKAFQYMNQAMIEQRVHSSAGEVIREEIRWYPFQIAFIMQEMDSIVHPEGEERKLVDLLWFPTGGGKTEAYLGAASFCMFYRRLTALQQRREDEGVAVIMRYTLRLLSFQQFERASSLICAMEMIRRRDDLGRKSFSIGLWAGSALTPNTLDDAEQILRTGKGSSTGTPVQVRKCPWCGQRLDERNYTIDKRNKKMTVSCSNEHCDFSSGLPVHLVDEDIYREKPSFIIGTIDKFAQLAFKEEAGNLLGVGSDAPPELIIQDELHLISGPLGTIAGVYEAAISDLCSRNGIKPKVIAATATIRNAGQQVKSLFNKEFRQFPPQGITMKDSYFAHTASKEEKATRLYMGFMPSGSSKSASFTRIMGSLLFATRYLEELEFDEEVIDSFWTETAYFNNLRELGSSIVRILDNVQDRFKYLRDTKFSEKYPISSEKDRYTRYYELTSRSNSAELGEVLQNQLFIPYKRDHSTKPYDFLVSSNMISVGVDINRLGDMVVVGQPIKTTEYIQATSRVGRSTPGLVITLYSQTKTRDRSHYEQFTQYHATFYRFVEATSITPFADRSRDRTLQALYVILCRYRIPELMPNSGAAQYNKNMSGLQEIRDYIVSYVAEIDPDEVENVLIEIEEIENYWDDMTYRSSNLVYWSYKKDANNLFKEDYQEGERFRMMNSMRNVEPAVGVSTEE